MGEDVSVVDVERLKRSWEQVAAHGDEVALRFYSRLFVAAPQTREMFPLSMVAQRDRLVTALGVTVSHVDDLDRLVPYLEQLGRDHRRFGVAAEHYAQVAEALFATLADFLGADWTAELAQDWADAYGLVAKTMHGAAERATRYEPAWWGAEVVDHERRTFDIAVLTLQPDTEVPYVAGQSVAVEVPMRPRLWRYYSPANAPREDGSIELHVRRIPGGQVSCALVDQVEKRDVLRLGAPVGERLTMPQGEVVDELLMVAGGTGLAPLRAVAEQLATQAVLGDAVPQVTLLVGARTARELYDLNAVQLLATEHPWLTVTAVVPEDPLHLEFLDTLVVPGIGGLGHGGGAGAAPRSGSIGGTGGVERGDVAEVAARRRCRSRTSVAYVCGSDRMVRATWRGLRAAGWPEDRIHYEGFQGLGGQSHGVLDPDDAQGAKTP